MNHPNRKSTRIPNYDYATPNYYFVTICTHEKQCLFGSVEQLNGYGQIALELLLEIPNRYSHASIDKFVVMPNHIHAIIVLRETPQGGTIPAGHSGTVQVRSHQKARQLFAGKKNLAKVLL